ERPSSRRSSTVMFHGATARRMGGVRLRAAAHPLGAPFRCSCYPPAPMDGVGLVLNQNYEPLNVCNLPRAFRLVFGDKAEVIEYDHQVIRTPRTEDRAPCVIRLQDLL